MIGRSVESISSRVPHLDRTTRPVERPPSESRVDQFKQALSAHVKALSQHQEALLGSLKNPNKETLKASLRAIYDLSKLPGGKAYVRGTVGEYVANHKMPKKLTPEQKPFVAVFAALSGNEYMFSKAGLTPEEMRLIKVGRKNLLHLACQGGKKEIIKTVSFAFEKKSARDPFESEYPSESFFLKKPWFEKAPMHYLTLELAKELHLEKAYLQYHSVISPKVDSAVVSAITFLPRAFQGAIAVASSSYQRKARLGESAAEGEQLIAKPSPFRANYAAKKALYDAFETLEAGQTEVPHLFDFALFKYVRANTFHYLGAAIEKGNYEIAAKMIANGYYNEISPRMLTILSLSPLNREQQFGLCREFLKRAYQTKNLDEQVLIMRHLISIPDGKKEAEKMLESLEPVDKEAQEEPHRIALAALLGDKTQFDAYFNQNAAACYLKTKTGQTIFHLACQGGNAEIIKILADGRPDPTNNPNPFLVEDVRPSVLGKLVETANRPIDFMTLETANELDRLYLHDPNAPGSFSMAVLHTFYVRTPIQLTAILGGALAGKLSGTVTVSALLPVLERITTAPIGTGAIHTMTEVSAAITESAALNIPVYGGAISGAVGTNWFGRRIVNSWRAEKLGLEDSLSQFEKPSSLRGGVADEAIQEPVSDGLLPASQARGRNDEPTSKPKDVEIKIKSVFGNQQQTDFEEHLANRRPDAALQVLKDNQASFKPQITETLVERLARIPKIEIETRAKILAKLIMDAEELENRPQDGHKAIETLLESQLELGHRDINQAVTEAIVEYLGSTESLTVGKLRSCLIIAVRLKNSDLIAKIQNKSEDLESLWLDTFVRREKSSVFGNVTQLDRGNTLMHVAAATGDARFIQWMAEQWAKHYQTRRQKDPGKEAKRRSVKGNLLERRPWQTDNESNRMNAELTSNPFSTPNALGQTPAQLLPASVARELDELYRIDSQKPGSFMEVARENLEAASIILGAEVAYALPAKLGLNIGLAHAVLAFVALGTSIGASKGGPVGAILGAVLAEFFMGTAIAGVGLAMGAVTGKKSIKIIRKMQNAARGYTREVTQLNPVILSQAKADLLAFCKTIISPDRHSVVDEIFSQEIKKPDDLAGLLVKLHGRIPELGEVVAEKAFAVVDLSGVEEAEEVSSQQRVGEWLDEVQQPLLIPALSLGPTQIRVKGPDKQRTNLRRSDILGVSRGRGLPNLDSSLRAERSNPAAHTSSWITSSATPPRNDEQTNRFPKKPNVQRVPATRDQPVIPAALSRDSVEIGVKKSLEEQRTALQSSAADRPVVDPKMRALSFYHDPNKVPGTKTGEHRSLQKIWDECESMEWMESEHDYIQWLFPLKEKTQHNLKAPILTDAEIKVFRRNELAQNNLRQSFNMMLGFYGLQQTQAGEVTINSKTFDERTKVWLTKGNHNYQRITRMLTSMRLLGLEKEAAAFFQCLTEIYNKNKTKIGKETFGYWQDAAPLDTSAISRLPGTETANTLSRTIINERWFKQGDIEAFKALDSKYPTGALQTQFAREGKGLRNVFGSGNCWITASNYVFLTEFRDKSSEERQTIITNFHSKWSSQSAVNYRRMLEKIDAHLQNHLLSDDAMMSLITSPEYMPVITDFVRSIPGLSSGAERKDAYGDENDIQIFAAAVGSPAFPIITAGTNTKGEIHLGEKALRSGAPKQLIFFYPPKGHQGGHYMVVEPIEK